MKKAVTIKAVTIKDIAEQLNMSRNTVSKALNGQYVPETTKKLVLDKAIELNYKLLGSENRKTFVKETKKRLLLLSGKPLNNILFFSPIIRSIENYCFSSECDLFQYTLNMEITSLNSLNNYIDDLKIDGILAIETFNHDIIDRILNLNIPICFIDYSMYKSHISGNYDIVEFNNFYPIYEITSKLINKYKITNFTFVGDDKHCLSFQERYFGMLSALAINDIPHSRTDDIVKSDNFNYGSSTMLEIEINKLKHKTHCFVCGNDFIARSICNVLERKRIRIPQDAMVIGFDNVNESYAGNPKITSIGTNGEELGLLAVKTLLSRIENPNQTTRTITMQSNIIERESTRR